MTESEKKKQGWVIWFVGLPGAGKSTYAKAVCQALEKEGIKFVYLNIDEKRETYIPNPKYTQEESEIAYKLFANEAILMSRDGINVVMDGTAPELSMRHYLRRKIKHFAEIYISCSLETAMVREELKYDGLLLEGLYEKALLRKEKGVHIDGPGAVAGIDMPFEEDSDCECLIQSDQQSVEQGRDTILDHIYKCYEKRGLKV